MNKKAALALVAAALAVGVGGAYAGTSGPHRTTPAPPTPRAASQSADRGLATRIANSVAAALSPTDRAAAAPSNSTPTPANLHDIVSAAIARAVADRHISTTEAALANLFLEGEIKPDPALRNAWRPIVQAAAAAAAALGSRSDHCRWIWSTGNLSPRSPASKDALRSLLLRQSKARPRPRSTGLSRVER